MKLEQSEEKYHDPILDRAISNMIALMRLNKHNKKSTPLMLAINLLREGSIGSFADFEQALSRRNSGIHFIAVPLDFYSAGCEVAYPYGDSASQPEYALKITMGGDLEAQKLLSDLKISPGENLERLKKTGVIRIPASRVPANNI